MYFTFIKKRKVISILALVLVGVFFALTLCFNKSAVVFSGKPLKKLPIYYVKTDEKKIAISFDCAWGTDYTDKLLLTMQKENVKCTFFMVKFWTEKYPEYVKKISDSGHEIGTHSSTHPYMSKLSKDAMISELSLSVKAIEDITHKKVQVFRPPYGDYNDLLIDTAKEMGLYTIQWDVDSLDWKNLSANEIKKRVLSRVKNGSIVLFHNQGLHTFEALPDIIYQLKTEGYKFVTIGDLIYKDNYKMTSDGGQQSVLPE